MIQLDNFHQEYKFLYSYISERTLRKGFSPKEINNHSLIFWSYILLKCITWRSCYIWEPKKEFSTESTHTFKIFVFKQSNWYEKLSSHSVLSYKVKVWFSLSKTFVKPNMKANWDGAIKLILKICSLFILKTIFSSTIFIWQSNFSSYLQIAKIKDFLVKKNLSLF